MSINVEYNNKEIKKLILENILKMLSNRKWLDSYVDVYKNLLDTFENKINFDVLLNNNLTCSIYLINTKLTTITQNSPLDEYLSSNIDVHKIIIAKNVTKKVIKQIFTEYKNAEFFFEYEMLEDITCKKFIPIHEILNEEEREELLSKFSEYELSKILVTDIMARYYGAKIGDIFRITRPSYIAGKNIFYRRVVNGTLDILFG
jgi:DNA-directed RNA polymerase subunit H (RpoH/RPB5)